MQNYNRCQETVAYTEMLLRLKGAYHTQKVFWAEGQALTVLSLEALPSSIYKMAHKYGSSRIKGAI